MQGNFIMTQKPHSPPTLLKDIQSKFSDAIFNSNSSTEYSHPASACIKETQSLRPEDRLQIYVDDYWNRCIDSLSEDFSKLENYLGNAVFISLLEGYLKRYPSRSYTLFYLGQDLETYIQEFYTKPNKSVVLEIAAYEWQLMKSSFDKVQTPLDPQKMTDPSELVTQTLYFQDHVYLTTIQTPTWFDSEKSSPQHVIIYKQNFKIFELILDPVEYQLLSLIHAGLSIEKSVDRLLANAEVSIDPANIQAWFQRAIRLHWFIDK